MLAGCVSTSIKDYVLPSLNTKLECYASRLPCEFGGELGEREGGGCLREVPLGVAARRRIPKPVAEEMGYALG